MMRVPGRNHSETDYLVPFRIPHKLAEADLPAISEETSVLMRRAENALLPINGGGTPASFVESLVLRSETLSSSHIENNPTSFRQLCLTLAGAQSKPYNREAVRHLLLLIDLLAEARNTPISEAVLLSDHRKLLSGERSAGKFRKPGDIGISRIGESIIDSPYICPPHEDVKELIRDWVKFVARRDVPVMQKIAWGHAQFESIHPFGDGNGRTGRIAIQRTLLLEGYRTVPISAALNAIKEAYVEALGSFREGEVEPILKVLAVCSLASCQVTEERTPEINNLLEEWNAVVETDKGARRNYRKALEWIAGTTAFTVGGLATGIGVSERTSHRIVNDLVERDVISVTKKTHPEKNTKRRRQIYEAPKMQNLWLEAEETIKERAEGYFGNTLPPKPLEGEIEKLRQPISPFRSPQHIVFFEVETENGEQVRLPDKTEFVVCQPAELFMRLPDGSMFLDVFGSGNSGIPFWILARIRGESKEIVSKLVFGDAPTKFKCSFVHTDGYMEVRQGVVQQGISSSESSLLPYWRPDDSLYSASLFSFLCAEHAITHSTQHSSIVRIEEYPDWEPPPADIRMSNEYTEIKGEYKKLLSEGEKLLFYAERLFTYTFLLCNDMNRELWNWSVTSAIESSMKDLRQIAGIKIANLFYDMNKRSRTLSDFRRTLERTLGEHPSSPFRKQVSVLLEILPTKENRYSTFQIGEQWWHYSSNPEQKTLPRLQHMRNKAFAHTDKELSVFDDPLYIHKDIEVIKRDAEEMLRYITYFVDFLTLAHWGLFQGSDIKALKHPEIARMIDHSIVWDFYDTMPLPKTIPETSRHPMWKWQAWNN